MLSVALAGRISSGGAQNLGGSSRRTLPRYDTTIKTNEVPWQYSLSWDAKSIATVGYNSGNVYLIDILTHAQTMLDTPQLPAKNFLCWSRDCKRLATGNIGTMIVVEIDQARTIRQIASPGNRAAAFSNDNSKVYVQNSDVRSSDTLIYEVDLNTGSARTLVEIPIKNAGAYLTLPGRFQSIGSADFFSCAIGRWNGRLGPRGRREFDFKSYVISLNGATQGPKTADLVVDFVRGIDGSGIVRALEFWCLYSRPLDSTIVFRPSGTKLTTVPVDVTKDKSFEVYDIDGHRMSTFGGYGSLEGNFIYGFDVHPTQPWAVTTTTRFTKADGRTVGLVTVWDLSTGEPLQRIETGMDVTDPIISSDGSLMTASSADGIEIFRFS
jgi:hypothetical protein